VAGGVKPDAAEATPASKSVFIVSIRRQRRRWACVATAADATPGTA
jgi:hypothetical protein